MRLQLVRAVRALEARVSLALMRVGNLPALLRPGPGGSEGADTVRFSHPPQSVKRHIPVGCNACARWRSLRMALVQLPTVTLIFSSPSRRGICLMTDSEARKRWYFFASLFTSFLFLLSFLRSSTDILSRPSFSASSQCLASPSTQICVRRFRARRTRQPPTKGRK